MCGIVGYIGPRAAQDVLVSALERLEYRGYDSAGICVFGDDKLNTQKTRGKINKLKELLDAEPLKGVLGIGHTRWATHGEPSKTNSHPHYDCYGEIAVVHNGIIENFQELKEDLAKNGHHFHSDTDTEVIAHLLEQEMEPAGFDLESALRSVLEKIKGSYAIACMSIKDPNSFVVARNGSPLIIGIGDGENFIASDVPAIIEYTKRVIYMDDYQMAKITSNGISLTDIHGFPIEQKISDIELDASDITKGEYPHYMLKEIHEQPEVIRRIMTAWVTENGKTHLDVDLGGISTKELISFKRIIIAACGTSFHAGLIGKFYLEYFAHMHTEVEIASEFRYRHFLADTDTLLIAITQSGETLDTLKSVCRAKEQGIKTLAMCNVVGSSIAREADGVVYTHAGPEIGVASTKAYTAQLATLLLLGLYIGQRKGGLNQAEIDGVLHQLHELPKSIETACRVSDDVLRCADRYFLARDFIFLGRGTNYPSALEGALKLKEVSYIHASGHPAGEIKHGPIALIDGQVPVVCIAPDDSTYKHMVSTMQEVKARKGKVIAVTTHHDKAMHKFADETIALPAISEILTPFVIAIPLQILAYYIAVKREVDVDQPRNLAKSVTVE